MVKECHQRCFLQKTEKIYVSEDELFEEQPKYTRKL